MRTAKLSVRLLHEFNTVWDGFSLQADDVDRALAALDDEYEVLSIYPVVWLPAPDTSVSEVDAAALRGSYFAADAAAPTNGTMARLAAAGVKRLDGAGVKVGVIDTGVDYRHPALGGGFGPGFKVAYGRDFVGDAFKPGGVPLPDADPMDCAGHGTHVAGIIAGSWEGTPGSATPPPSPPSPSPPGPAGVGARPAPPSANSTNTATTSAGSASEPVFRFQGVAPGVTLGAYRVFGCSGGTTSELVVAAMDAAAQDGMNVINLSLGDEGAWGGPVAEAADRLAAMGILVVAAAGNAGASGLFMQSSAAAADSVLSVAAVQSYAAPTAPSLTVSVPAATADGGVRTVGVLAAYGDVAALAYAVIQPTAAALATGAAAGAAAADGCSAAVLGDVAGAVALIAAGGCAVTIKAANAAARGALGVILYGDATVLNEVYRTPLLGSPATWASPYSPYGLPLLVVDTDTGRSLFEAYRTRAAAAFAPPSPQPQPPVPPVPPPTPGSPAPRQPAQPPSPSPPPGVPSTPPPLAPPQPPVPSSPQPSPSPRPPSPPSPRPPSPPAPPSPSAVQAQAQGPQGVTPPPLPAPPAPSPPRSSPQPAPSGSGGSGSSSPSPSPARLPPSPRTSPSPPPHPSPRLAPAPQRPPSPQPPPSYLPLSPPPPPSPKAQSSPALTPRSDGGAASPASDRLAPAPAEMDSALPPPSLDGGADAGASGGGGGRRRLRTAASGGGGGGSEPWRADPHLYRLARRRLARRRALLQDAAASAAQVQASGSSATATVTANATTATAGGAADAASTAQAAARALPTILTISGSLVSPFSSWGPAPDLKLRPSLAAPGGAVLSTRPLTRSSTTSATNGASSTTTTTTASGSGFAYLSGTSQAAPFVAGAAALYLAATRARLAAAGQTQSAVSLAAQVQAALIATARPLPDFSTPSPSVSSSSSSSSTTSASNVTSPTASNSTTAAASNATAAAAIAAASLASSASLVSPLRVGGGVVDLAALATNLVDASPAALEVGSGLAARGYVTLSVELVNRGSAPLVFRLLHRGSAAVDASAWLTVGANTAAAVAANATAVGNSTNANNTRYATVNASALAGLGVGGPAGQSGASAVVAVFTNTRARAITNITLAAGGQTRFRVTFSLADWVPPGASLLLSGYIALEPVAPSAAAVAADPAVALQPPLYLPYLAASAPLTSLPVLLPSLPGGMTDPGGVWWWDEAAAGYSVASAAPPPAAPPPGGFGTDDDGSYNYDQEEEEVDDGDEADDDGYDAHSPPPASPPQRPLFSYALYGARASLPSVGLFLQRQPAAQELLLYSASYGGAQLGYVSTSQTVRRPVDGAPLVLSWRGTYYDLGARREVLVGPGDYFFMVRMTRPPAAADSGTAAAAEAVYDTWRTPVFRLTRT